MYEPNYLQESSDPEVEHTQLLELSQHKHLLFSSTVKVKVKSQQLPLHLFKQKASGQWRDKRKTKKSHVCELSSASEGNIELFPLSCNKNLKSFESLINLPKGFCLTAEHKLNLWKAEADILEKKKKKKQALNPRLCILLVFVCRTFLHGGGGSWLQVSTSTHTHTHTCSVFKINA